MASNDDGKKAPIEADEPPRTQEEFIAQVQEYYEKRKGLENLLNQMFEDQAKEGEKDNDKAGDGKGTANVGSNDTKYSAVAETADTKRSSRDQTSDRAHRPDTTTAALPSSTAEDGGTVQGSANSENVSRVSPGNKLEQHVDDLNLND